MNVVAIVLALSLAGLETQPAAKAPEPAPEISEPRDWSRPPPGTAEDQALWTALYDAQNASVVHLGRIAQASYRLRWAKYYEALDEKAKTGKSADAEGARKARAKIEAAAKAADEAIPKQGLRVRVCKYTLLSFDQRMSFPEDATFRAELPRYRAEAKGCVDELAPFAAKLAPLADAFEASLAEADVFMERAPPPVPPAPAQEGGAPSGAR